MAPARLGNFHISRSWCRFIATAAAFATLSLSQSSLAAESTLPGSGSEAAMPAEEPSPWARTDRYHLSFGARAAVGMGFDTEMAKLVEGFARYQWRHGLGLEASFFHLDSPNNESYPSIKANALTLGPTWHPFKDFWFDPFVGAHLVGFVELSGFEAAAYSQPSGLGVEGILGLQIASRHLAGGIHARMGTSGHPWLLYGVQVEARF